MSKSSWFFLKLLMALGRNFPNIFIGMTIIGGIFQWVYYGSFPNMFVVGAVLLLYKFSKLDLDLNDERTQLIRQKSALIGYASALVLFCTLYVIVALYPSLDVKNALLIAASIVTATFPLSIFVYSRFIY
ncbi:hypothetical protein [Baia soyae]|uniref:Uncharacterized protein n=1 Tax=Baia soyae TaxID=1544746 RepID=A0A4R2S2M7_9BACL|nr:hypothetical protein [Baia soyae]TCP70583.1 hypothetical protein EDD57_10123 [Baia soyae]